MILEILYNYFHDNNLQKVLQIIKTMNQILTKKIIDIVLIILFLCELGGFFFPSNFHIIIGTIFLILILVHNILNFNFYKNIFKGKYTFTRALNTICILLFAISLIIIAFSGITMASNISFENSIFADLNWRSIHLNASIISVILFAIHVIYYAKRYIKGKSFYAISVIAIISALASIFVLPYLERWCHKVNIEKNKIIQGEKIALNKKVLTVYFTRVGNTNFPADVDAVSGASVMREKDIIYGNTQMIAYMIQDAVGGYIEAISTEKKYLPSYMDTIKEAGKEFSDTKLPIIKSSQHNPNEYDIIFVVYPLWWGTIPKAVESYITAYNFSGKIVVPVVTHGGGSFKKSIKDFEEKSETKAPDKILDIYSSSIPNSRQKIADYIKELSKTNLH